MSLLRSPFELSPVNQSHEHASLLGTVGEKMKRVLKRREGRISLPSDEDEASLKIQRAVEDKDAKEKVAMIDRLITQAEELIPHDPSGAEHNYFMMIDACITLDRDPTPFIEGIIEGIEHDQRSSPTGLGYEGGAISHLLDYDTYLSESLRARLDWALRQLHGVGEELAYAKKLVIDARNGRRISQAETEGLLKDAAGMESSTLGELHMMLAEIALRQGESLRPALKAAHDTATGFARGSVCKFIITSEERMGLYEESLETLKGYDGEDRWKLYADAINNKIFPVAYRQSVLELFWETTCVKTLAVGEEFNAYAEFAASVVEIEGPDWGAIEQFEDTFIMTHEYHRPTLCVSMARIEQAFGRSMEDVSKRLDQAEQLAEPLDANASGTVFLTIARYRRLFGCEKGDLATKAEHALKKVYFERTVNQKMIEAYVTIDPLRVSSLVDTAVDQLLLDVRTIPGDVLHEYVRACLDAAIQIKASMTSMGQKRWCRLPLATLTCD